MTAIFQARGVTKTYTGAGNDLQVLSGIDIALEAGEMVAIVGASGSGKTTLLQILGTLAQPTAGEMYFQSEPLTQHSEKSLADFRNRSLGFIFQFHHLLPEFSALENVMMPALIAGKTRQEMAAPALELLTHVELEERLNHRVAELSGGEQQRTALARSLIMKPALLLADEPTGNLDTRAGNLVFELLQKMCRERSLATIMVTHNMDLAHRLDRIYTLANGKLTTP